MAERQDGTWSAAVAALCALAIALVAVGCLVAAIVRCRVAAGFGLLLLGVLLALASLAWSLALQRRSGAVEEMLEDCHEEDGRDE